MKYGIKRLAKIEKQIEQKLKRQAKRYDKDYLRQMVHFDVKQLPVLEGQSSQHGRDYLFIAIDDYFRELFATIMPDKTQHSAKRLLE